MTTTETQAAADRIGAELDALTAELDAQRAQADAGEGFAARLSAYLHARVAAYERSTPAAPEWRRLRSDLCRRLAIVVAQLGDSDPAVRLAAGREHDPRNTDAAIARLLSHPPDPALEALDAASRRDSEADYLTPGANTLERAAWMRRRSEASFRDDVEHHLQELAVAAHAAEYEKQAREIDRLQLRLEAAENPAPRITELEGRLANVQAEAAALRARNAQEASNTARLESLVVALRAKVREISWSESAATGYLADVAKAVGAKTRAEAELDVDALILRMAGDRESNRDLWTEIAAALRERGIERREDTIRKLIARARRSDA